MSTPKQPATFKPDIPRRVVEVPGAPRRAFGDAPQASSPAPGREEPRKLIVGREISLAGEITSCDHLVVEGRIEARIRDCQTIDILDAGMFKGSAEIEDADIGGRFEGDLSVKGRLRIRATGVVSGNVKYGQLEVENGGRLIGSVEPLGTQAQNPQGSLQIAPVAPLASFADQSEE